MTNKSNRAAMAMLLVGLLPTTAIAQQDSNVALALAPREPVDLRLVPAAEARAAAVTPRPVAYRAPTPGLSQKLLKKKVVVYLRDGRILQGKVVKLSSDSLHLRMAADSTTTGKAARRIEEIPLAGVERVGRRVKPKLIGQKVVVYLHSGQTLKGRLTKLSEDSLQVQDKWGTREIPLRQVARVKRKPVNWEKAGNIAAGVAGLMLIGVVCGAIESSGDSCFD